MAFWRFWGCCEMCCAMCSGSHPANLTERLLPAITANREQQPASSKLKHTNTDRREKKEHPVNSSIDRGKRTGRHWELWSSSGATAAASSLPDSSRLLLFFFALNRLHSDRETLSVMRLWRMKVKEQMREKRCRKKPNQDPDQTKPRVIPQQLAVW